MAGLRKDLRRIGPEAFIEKYVTSRKIPTRLLGTVFGIDPGVGIDSAWYVRVLCLAILRAYHKRQKLMQYNTIDDAANLLRESKNIMVITGAGISTSLGIPDFRSRGTGFYDKIRALGFESGEDVFDIHMFDEDPSIFYSLAGDILPDQQRYTPTHAFIKLLQDKGKLQTNYTQNIDNLEELAGIDRARLIQCHGSFATASCRKCKVQVSGQAIFADIRAKRVALCKTCLQNPPAPRPQKKRKHSKPRKNGWEDSDDDESSSSTAYDIPQPGVMKPDITFFGEQLPDTFFNRFTDHDSPTVDLCLVIGTSLKVAPVSEMANHLPQNIPHIFISREPIEHVNFDIQLLGDCDYVVYELCRRAGWELRHEMIPEEFRVKVRPVEEFSYRWQVKPRKSKAAAVAAADSETVGSGRMLSSRVGSSLAVPPHESAGGRTPSPLRSGPACTGIPGTTSPSSRNGYSPQAPKSATPQIQGRSVPAPMTSKTSNSNGSSGSGGDTFFALLQQSVSKPPPPQP